MRKQQLKPATSADLRDVASALHHLRMARDYLRRAGCDRSADYVARALKSAEGAQRHAYRRHRETVAAEGRDHA